MTLRLCIGMLFIILGLVVIAISILGLFRFRDSLERLHAGALIDTLGLLLILGGLSILIGFSPLTLKLVALIIILWLANPVSSHLIAQMEVVTGRNMDVDPPTGEGEQEL